MRARRPTSLVIWAFVLVLALPGTLRAQYSITSSVIAGGGGTLSGGTYVLSGTTGQAVAAPASIGGTLGLAAGFWTSAVNTPPTISDITDRTIAQNGNTGLVPFSVADAQTAAGLLVVTGVSSNTTLVPNAAIVLGGSGGSRTVRVTPAAGQSGVATITITVTDGGGLTATDAFVLTVSASPSNTSPTITDISDRTLTVGGTTGPLAFTVGDAQTAAGSLAVSAATSNGTLVPLANVVFGGSGAARTVTVTPAANVLGTATITVTVTDGGGLSASDTFLITVTSSTTVTITSPTSDPAATVSSGVLALGGQASSHGTVTSVAWTTDRGGSGTATFSGPPAPGTPRAWTADVPVGNGATTITVTATDDVAQTATDTLSVSVSELTYYLAEGATGTFFDLDVALANPNAEAAPVTLTFLKDDGTTVTQDLTLAPQSRQTVFVEQVAGLESTAVSTVVTSRNGLPLMVERSMFWSSDYYGAHGGTAVESPGTRWYFAEGSQGFFDTYVLLANAGAAPANVTLTYLREGEAPIVAQRTVAATSRLNVWAGEVAGLGSAFSTVVDSDVPIIAERAMYFPAGLPTGKRFWEGGHESAGVAAASTDWFHAEGATGAFFDEYVLIANPGDVDATVTFTFLLDTGQTVVAQKVVPARSRFTVDVENLAAFAQGGLVTLVSGDAALLADAAVSTTVHADQPIISERAMYWPGTYATWAEAHNSFGVTSTATAWGLGEGRTGGPHVFETYVLVANPNASEAHVTLTFLREDGRAPVVKVYTVPPTSRYNVAVTSMVPEIGDGERFGVIVRSDVPIAVERAMYNNDAGGAFWAAGTNATASRLP